MIKLVCLEKNKTVEPLKTYEIIRAIKNNEIAVLYQPQVSLSSREFIGVEALCRINHPRLGLVSPDKFINKAEESELITFITFDVLKKVMIDWRAWYMSGLNIQLSVNISPIALDKNYFYDRVFNIIKGLSMPSEKLCLEITEDVLANDHVQELVNFNRLGMRGVELALDDFGQKNATVDRLQQLPLN